MPLRLPKRCKRAPTKETGVATACRHNRPCQPTCNLQLSTCNLSQGRSAPQFAIIQNALARTIHSRAFKDPRPHKSGAEALALQTLTRLPCASKPRGASGECVRFTAAFARTPRSQSPRAQPPAPFAILLAGRASASSFNRPAGFSNANGPRVCDPQQRETPGKLGIIQPPPPATQGFWISPARNLHARKHAAVKLTPTELRALLRVTDPRSFH